MELIERCEILLVQLDVELASLILIRVRWVLRWVLRSEGMNQCFERKEYRSYVILQRLEMVFKDSTFDAV